MRKRAEARPPREEARARREDVERSERDGRGPGQDRVDGLFARLDKNSDGVLTKDEFAPVAGRLEAMAQRARQEADSLGHPGWGGRGPAWDGPPPAQGGMIWWGDAPWKHGFGPYGWSHGDRVRGPHAMYGPLAVRGMGRGPAMEGPQGRPGPWWGQRPSPGPRPPRGDDRPRPETKQEEQEQEQD